MNRYRKLSIRIFLAFVLPLFVPLLSTWAQSTAAPLRVGDSLPDVAGQNLLGSQTHLSTLTTGKVAVVVFSFSKAGGKDTQLWNRQVLRDFGSNHSVTLSTVIMLESAPRLLRGVIVSGIKNDMPVSLRDSTIVSYENEKLWKQCLAVTDDGRAYVLVLGKEGHILWMNSDAFGTAEYRDLTTKIQEQLHSAKANEVR